MKAIRVHAFGEAPRIDEVDAPRAAPGRTIVEMRAATVGHIDRTIWSGRFRHHPPLPYVPGVEAAGIVLASGTYAVGERVWVRGSALGVAIDGTWCELIDAPDAAVGRLPDGLAMAIGAAFFSPCTSAWVALHDVARVQPGDHVLVTGASGAVGSVAVELATAMGATVSALVREAAQARRLPEGVAALIASDAAGASIAADVLLDTVGGAVLPAMLGHVVPGGRAVLVGYAAGEQLAIELPDLMLRDVTLLPLNMMRREAAARACVPEVFARLADGRIRVQTRSFAFEDAAAALAWIVQRGHTGRAVLSSPT